MHPLYAKHDFPKLTLAVLYLITRIHTQATIENKESPLIFGQFF